MTYEFSLVCFTVFGQLAAGLVLLIWVAGLRRFPDIERRAWRATVVFGVIAAVGATTHLHSLLPAPYSLTGVGTSWLSREIWAGGIFGALVLLRVLGIFKESFNPILGLLGVCFVIVMAQIYFQNTIVPLWSNWGTPIAFLAAMLLLGGATTAALAAGSEAGKDPWLIRVCLHTFVVGAIFSFAPLAFWLGALADSIDPAKVRVWSTAAVCITLTQMVAYIAGEKALIFAMPDKRSLAWLGALLALIGVIVGRMLFYAANIKIGL